MKSSSWIHQTVTCSSYWDGCQLSVKQWGWRSAPLCPRQWFSAGKGWIAHFASGKNCCSIWRSSNMSGSSCSWVRGILIRRLTNWCGTSIDADTIPGCCSNERVELEGEALSLPGSMFYPSHMVTTPCVENEITRLCMWPNEFFARWLGSAGRLLD